MTRSPQHFQDTRRFFRGLLVLATMVSTACGDDETPSTAPATETGTAYYAGPADGTSARVGIAVKDGRVVLFLCGGADDPSDTAWGAGTVDAAGAIALQAGGPMSVDAQRTPDVVEGTLTRARGTTHFRAALLRGEPTGVWDAREPEGRVGLIVSSPGDDGEAQGVMLELSRRALQVTPVRPLRVFDRALAVTIPDLSREVRLLPVTP